MTSNTLLQRIRQHQYLRDLRNKLLYLHKMLLETERIAYEQISGRVSSTELLQLVIGHEQFAWLHRISEMVVQIDEMLIADEPIALDDLQKLIADVRTLIVPLETGNTFERKYYNALQSEPAAVLAHAEISKLLMSNVQ
ncbi:hypothetical protein H6G93_11530 [Nostoc sp. FACHB-973]|uniref:Uncharacterized protein n=1 Tax=Desmonostoc muscorum LEGE 12446 TaxID=1828758 RepID=A0A8J7D2S2_DESMC|nr:hypothetical protein [Desmonostoc muscorum]MBD2414734.1 hypothetical protein [Nostoc calcicola FACHB-3891]MBD2515634.1 hypothetical protein [Nostoc sp. FACHB-973]MBX9254611.1 hypothetical protein [Desmonostoc muscorum CCALA 125]MCF2149004.1 hypothetical protein [Desmonostoc muscorum LEGE 12446]